MAEEKYAIDINNQQAYYLQPAYQGHYEEKQPTQTFGQPIIKPDEPPPAEYYENQGGLKINRRSTFFCAAIQLIVGFLMIAMAIMYITLVVPYNYYQDFWIGCFVIISGFISLIASKRPKPGRGIIGVSLALCLFCLMLSICGVVLLSVFVDWSRVFADVCLGRRPNRYMQMWDWQKQEMLVKCHTSKIPYEYQWIFYMLDLILFVFEVVLMMVLSIFYSKALCCRTSSTY